MTRHLAAALAAAVLLTACSSAEPAVQQPPAAVWPAGLQFIVTGDMQVRVLANGNGLEALDASGKRVWTWETGGKLVERWKGSPDGKYVLAMTLENYILLDTATGKELGVAPLKGTQTPGGKWTAIFWKGDRIYISQDSWLGDHYSASYFVGFRLVPSGDKVTWEKFTEEMVGAPNLSVSSDGRTVVHYGLSGTPNTLFVDGKRVRALPAGMSLLPDSSGLYSSPKGSLTVYDLEGKPQWERALPTGFSFGGPWQGDFVAVNPAGGWMVLKGKDGMGAAGQTELMAITPRHLVVRAAGGGLDLIGTDGKVAAHLPEKASPMLSDDGRWLWFSAETEIHGYRLP